MLLIRDLYYPPAPVKGAVIALGNFDGLHVGHQAVLQKTRQLAESLGAPSAVMTFEPHPRRLFRPELPPLRILPLSEKLRRLREENIDFVCMQRFTHEFSHITADAFISDLLVKSLNVSGIVTGENFHFGYKRGGDSKKLQKAAKTFGFDYVAMPATHVRDDRCSSTRLRGALASGDVELAQQLLGRPYSLHGRIVKGDQRGRDFGFPTANLHLTPGLFHAAFGIYAIRLRVAEENKSYEGVANFGIRPMYRLEKPILESHLFDVSPDLYGKRVSVELCHYIRNEAAFDSESALITQMKQDKQDARHYFAKQHDTRKQA